jgi:hypothetical protein
MRYQPTLFLPIEVIDRINMVILPLEKSISALANYPVLTSSMRKMALHNLECLSKYKAHQHNLNIHDENLMLSAKF